MEQVMSRSFNDSDYESPEAARDAAIAWHKEASSLFPQKTYKEYFQKVSGTPKSGHTGVHRAIGKSKGYSYPQWLAKWKLNGKTHTRTFSVKKFGEEGAKQKAIEARAAVQKQIEEEWAKSYWNYKPHNINDRGYIDDPFAYEGDQNYQLHLEAERDVEIRKVKIERFLEEHGKLFCEICDFSFEEAYGEVGRGLIEVHHLLSFAELKERRKTRLSDLMCVCSNCHFALHNGDHTENLRRLNIIFHKVTRKKDKKD